MIHLRTVRKEEKELLWNIHQKYLYEMTHYYDDVMDETGNYHYGYFEDYFTDPNRSAVLIFLEETLIGFAMIHPYSYFDAHPDHVMAEFTIFPMYRKQKLGTAAAKQILETCPGSWEIKYHEQNTGAKALWNQVSESYHPERHQYSEAETVLVFSV